MFQALESLTHAALLIIDPEKAHDLAKKAMKMSIFAPGPYKKEESRKELFGVRIDNPLGIAAGFDKYAQLQSNVRKYGFGWIEEGSFTWKGGKGNPKPRLFRLSDGSLLNRMGLNCISASEASYILEKADQNSFAVSVAKTHDPAIVGDKAIDDVINSYKFLNHFGIYTAINLSCPNTKEGKTFEEPEALRDLVSALREARKYKSTIFKFSPNIPLERLEKILIETEDFADGYEAINTISREYKDHGRGGVSGPIIKDMALKSLSNLRNLTKKPIIAVGGISTGKDMYALKNAGADAFLAFTGFVYKHPSNPHAGPRFAHKVLNEYYKLKEVMDNGS